jgi:hypothetical protein
MSLCGPSSETIQHVTACCPKRAQITYKHQHDQVTKTVHHKLSKQLHLHEEPYYSHYEHEPPVALENNYRLYCDRTLLTGKTVHFTRPDLTLVHKRNKEDAFTDVAIPLTHNLKATIAEEQGKYHDLAFEIKQQRQRNKGIVQKTLNTNKCTKSLFSSIITHSYMFRPCWVIFRKKPSVAVHSQQHILAKLYSTT